METILCSVLLVMAIQKVTRVVTLKPPKTYQTVYAHARKPPKDVNHM